MCEFVSGYALPPDESGECEVIDHADVTDGHSLMLRADGIRNDDLDAAGLFEFTPPDDHAKIADMDSWTFTWDTAGYSRLPSWITPEIEAQVRGKISRRVASWFVDSYLPLLGGIHIITTVGFVHVHGGRVVMYNNASAELYVNASAELHGNARIIYDHRIARQEG